MAFDPQDEPSYLSFRVAIASGLFASLGASLAWLMWMVSRVSRGEMIITVAVGVAVGLIVHWCKHYLHVVRHEVERKPVDDEPVAGPFGANHRFMALVWAGGFAILGLATEHLVAHMAANFLLPLLASLASLVPAGVILGYMMHKGYPRPREAHELLWRALVAGLSISGITWMILNFGWGNWPWFPMFCWWFLVSFGILLNLPEETNATRVHQPICGILVAFILMVGLSSLPDNVNFYSKFGSFGSAGLLARDMAVSIIHSPNLPSEFWLKAQEQGLKRDALERRRLEPLSDRDLANAAVRAGTKGKVSITEINKPVTQEDISRHINSPLAPPDWAASLKEIWGELQRGTDSPLFCSWLVLLLFGVGLGYAPAIERSLRPPDYPSTSTFKKDITVAVALVVAILSACIGARISGDAVLPRSSGPETTDGATALSNNHAGLHAPGTLVVDVDTVRSRL